MIKKVFQCKTCGEKFQIEVLSSEDIRERERIQKPMYLIRCKNCGSGNIMEI